MANGPLLSWSLFMECVASGYEWNLSPLFGYLALFCVIVDVCVVLVCCLASSIAGWGRDF
jgi:hypothetical protein